MEVGNYGLHWDGNIAWLIQGRGGNNFVGVKAQVPFRATGGMCNHLVPSAAPIPDRIHWEMWQKVADDPLVKAMLPLPAPPGRNVFYVNDPYDDLGYYLNTLSRLSSPIKPVVKPAWMFKVRDLERELHTTNIQPLVLVQADQKCQPLVDTIGKLALYTPRTVVITGKPEVVARTPIQRITSDIRSTDISDLMTLPMENLGALLIRRHARREDINAPLESREDRRNRQIRERSKK